MLAMVHVSKSFGRSRPSSTCPLLSEVREEMGLDPDPYRAYLGSGYQERIIAERVGGTRASW